LDSFSF